MVLCVGLRMLNVILLKHAAIYTDKQSPTRTISQPTVFKSQTFTKIKTYKNGRALVPFNSETRLFHTASPPPLFFIEEMYWPGYLGSLSGGVGI